MDDVISKLAEIELAASKIMENVVEEKKSLSLENEARIKAFDDEVDKRQKKNWRGYEKGLKWIWSRNCFYRNSRRRQP